MSDVFYDLETKELVDTSNPDRNAAIRSLHFSVGASDCECHREKIFYRAEELADHLLAHERIIGHSIVQFDNLVLANESDDELKSTLDRKSFDLGRELHARLGYQVSLASLAAGTIGNSARKQGSAAAAVVWYRLSERLRHQFAYALREVGDADGAQRAVEFGEYLRECLERYCAGDVQLVRQVFEYAIANRRVAFIDVEGERRIVKVDWR
jgi:hypothetical protein